MASMGDKARAGCFPKRQTEAWGKLGGKPVKITGTGRERLEKLLASGVPWGRLQGYSGFPPAPWGAIFTNSASVSWTLHDRVGARRPRYPGLALLSLEFVGQGRGVVHPTQHLDDGATVDCHGAIVHLVVGEVADQAFDVSIENQSYQLALPVDDWRA